MFLILRASVDDSDMAEPGTSRDRRTVLDERLGSWGTTEKHRQLSTLRDPETSYDVEVHRPGVYTPFPKCLRRPQKGAASPVRRANPSR